MQLRSLVEKQHLAVAGSDGGDEFDDIDFYMQGHEQSSHNKQENPNTDMEQILQEGQPSNREIS